MTYPMRHTFVIISSTNFLLRFLCRFVEKKMTSINIPQSDDILSCSYLCLHMVVYMSCIRCIGLDSHNRRSGVLGRHRVGFCIVCHCRCSHSMPPMTTSSHQLMQKQDAWSISRLNNSTKWDRRNKNIEYWNVRKEIFQKRVESNWIIYHVLHRQYVIHCWNSLHVSV